MRTVLLNGFRELGGDVILFEDFSSQLRMQAQADALGVCCERLQGLVSRIGIGLREVLGSRSG